ncbi:MAG: hypothetical protein ACI8X5_003608 [Planctomycetota bacterium]|jgi:hypothetical protein
MSYAKLNFAMASAATLALALPAGAAAASPQQTPQRGLAQTARADGSELPSGVTPSDWSFIRDSISAHRHAFESTHIGFEARNPRFNWEAQFDGTSALIQPAAGGWSFGFALKAFGFEGQLQEVQSPMFGACAEGQKITYGWTGELSEWWINDKRGFEHGFTVHERPARLEADDVLPLVFELDTIGSLQPRVNEARTGLSLQDDAGSSVLRYDGLVAFDSNGIELSAWLEVDERSVRICVDETLAEYPIIVDPVVQEAYIKASNTDAGDQFGVSVAASGDTVVIGAYAEDSSATGIDGDESSNSAVNSGAAYVFVRSGSSWIQQAYLKASNTDAIDLFGVSVAVSGDTIVVGARNESSNATGIDGDQFNNSANASGAAYVFVRSGSSWTQQAYLKASNTDQNDLFGHSVAASGDTVVVGAVFESSGASGVDGDQFSNSANDSGAAYVFVRSGFSWTQQAYLKASNTGPGDEFGYSVAASGDTVVVGARYEDSNATGIDGDQFNNSANASGAAYIFVRSGSSWTQSAYLKASNTDADDYFGRSVAASGDTVVVGANQEGSNATGIDGDQSSNSAGNSGAAYIFVRSGSSWTQAAYLKASNTGVGDWFGWSVAASGDTIVVGARSEKSNATGIDGNQFNNSASGAGAAYVFVRSGSSWTQAAYLKASNTGGLDLFGQSVAASGDTVVVGANQEDSSAAGIDGDQSNNSAPESGAVYFIHVDNTGSAYCFGDGSGVACPCSAFGGSGEGCANTGGAGGATLTASGNATLSNDTFQLQVSGIPGAKAGLCIKGSIQLPGGNLVGDGLLCTAPQIRSQVIVSDASGGTSMSDWRGQPFGTYPGAANVGAASYYQWWYRDPSNTCSGSGFNFSNAWAVTWLP